MAERPRDDLAILTGSLWGYVLGWRVTFRANIYGPLDEGMVILQLCCWKFHIKNFVAGFICLKLNFVQKRKNAFWAALLGLTGNVRTPSIAGWKARGQLPIRHNNWTFFAISYGWDVISGNLSKSAFFTRVGSLWAQISDGKGSRNHLLLA